MLPVECRRVSITSALVSLRRRRPIAQFLLAASLVFLGGCDAADDSGSAPSVSVASDELRRGELLSYACQACHTLKPGGQHQVGPNLAGVFGRVAGTAPGFDFSPALRESGIVWSPEQLDGWLANPAGFLPGTSMTFTGFQSPEDRAALIEYLITATAP
jgi:cytochrome c